MESPEKCLLFSERHVFCSSAKVPLDVTHENSSSVQAKRRSHQDGHEVVYTSRGLPSQGLVDSWGSRIPLSVSSICALCALFHPVLSRPGLPASPGAWVGKGCPRAPERIDPYFQGPGESNSMANRSSHVRREDTWIRGLPIAPAAGI